MNRILWLSPRRWSPTRTQPQHYRRAAFAIAGLAAIATTTSMCAPEDPCAQATTNIAHATSMADSCVERVRFRDVTYLVGCREVDAARVGAVLKSQLDVPSAADVHRYTGVARLVKIPVQDALIFETEPDLCPREKQAFIGISLEMAEQGTAALREKLRQPPN